MPSHRPQTFLKWLYAQSDRDDPIGDLANDARRDKNPSKPVGRTTRDDWASYVSRRGGCPGALSAIDAAWDEFEAWRDE